MIVILFIIAALYDGSLGIAFLFSADALFKGFQITPPNHFGYVHFPAALLIVFTLMFLAIARNPQGNRNLIPYGILLKVSYCSVVCYHWFTVGIPDPWKPYVFYDHVFQVLFTWSYISLRDQGKKQPTVP